jgi:hypothetical protein
LIVEKWPICPLYTPKQWRQYQASLVGGKTRTSELPYPYKPQYYNRPAHWAICFPQLVLSGEKFDRAMAGDDPVAPQILIHRTAEWTAIMEDGKFDPAAGKQKIRALREMVDQKDPYRSPVLSDTKLACVSAKKALHFTGGHGFRVLAQRVVEADVLRRGQLHYLFLGISDDGSCQIVATFPLDLPGLPRDTDDASHLGFGTKRYEEFQNQYSRYENAARRWLEKNVDKTTPPVLELDRMISSLVVRRWE